MKTTMEKMRQQRRIPHIKPAPPCCCCRPRMNPACFWVCCCCWARLHRPRALRAVSCTSLCRLAAPFASAECPAAAASSLHPDLHGCASLQHSRRCSNSRSKFGSSSATKAWVDTRDCHLHIADAGQSLLLLLLCSTTASPTEAALFTCGCCPLYGAQLTVQ